MITHCKMENFRLKEVLQSLFLILIIRIIKDRGVRALRVQVFLRCIAAVSVQLQRGGVLSSGDLKLNN